MQQKLNFSDDGKTPWIRDQFHAAHIVFAEEERYVDDILAE